MNPYLHSRFESFWLNSLRAGAALIVLLSHWRNLLFVDYARVEDRGVLAALFYFVTGIGRQGVIIFFVLSGYLIVGAILRSHYQGVWDLKEFAVSRFARLYIVLIPALLLGLLLDSIGAFGLHGILYGPERLTTALLPSAAERIQLWALMGNAAFLQGITVPTFGSNDPLWSLSYEFWYYVLAVLGFYVVIAKTRPRQLVLLLMALAVYGVVGGTMAAYSLIWALGGGIWLLRRKGWLRRLPWTAVLIAGVASVAVSITLHRLAILNGFGADVLLGCSTCLLIYGASIGPAEGTRLIPAMVAKVSGIGARISYTGYLMHMPILVLAATVFGIAHDLLPNLHGMVVAGVVLLSVVAYIVFSYFLFESRTDVLKSGVLALVDTARGRQPLSEEVHEVT